MRASLGAIALALALTGCAGAGLATRPTPAAERANSNLAQDFLDLTFRLETGQVLERLLKYEGPVRVALDPALSSYADDLAGVLGAIRRGADIDIAPGGAESQIYVINVPAAQLRSAVPGAACFVAPGVQSWAEFRANPRLRWSRLTTLDRAAVFIPDDAAPYAVRACLNEEIGQALGPVNDLYRLPDSVFNDDNIHLQLTGFDLLMLRILYSPELRVGMSRDAASAALPGLLARLNRAGQNIAYSVQGVAPQGWQRALEAALDPRQTERARAAAARTALALGRQISPPDHRLVLSLLIAGRFELASAPESALAMFGEAHRLSLAQLGPRNLRSAQTGYHLAAALLSKDPAASLELVAEFLPVAVSSADSPLESGLLAVRAVAYLRLGRLAEAEDARQASLARAIYSFGGTAEDQDPTPGLNPVASRN
tara:strand:- start:1342 stop:2625 length:1284 start_codon:yes stop_codon:yes gene_type:complete